MNREHRNLETRTVRGVVSAGHCIGCGTCVAMCPQDAVLLLLNERKGVYEASVAASKCTLCGLCLRVCPAPELGDSALPAGSAHPPSSAALIGEYRACYLGHSTRDEVRHQASSGGIVTQLLLAALDAGLIDSALVTRMSQNEPLRPEPFLARTVSEIAEAATSKYCPVPANLALRQVLTTEARSVAVVGLPCHLRGVRLAMRHSPALARKVSYLVGIFCSHGDSTHGTEFVLRRSVGSPEGVESFSYRGDGWPGGISVLTRQGSGARVPLNTPLWRAFHDSLFFCPSACLRCADLAAEQADVSCGDAWLPEVMARERDGESVVVTRTDAGGSLVKAAMGAGVVDLAPLDPRKVVQSQAKFVHYKKVNYHDRRGSELPRGSERPSRGVLGNRIVAGLVRSYGLLGASSVGRQILDRLPVGALDLLSRLLNRVHRRVMEGDRERLGPYDGPNVLVLHAHWNNRGDEAATRAMVRALRDRLPVARMSVMLMTAETARFPEPGVAVIPRYPWPRLAYLDAVLTLFTWGRLSLTRRGRRFLAAARSADLVIHAPGGPSIGDLYGGRTGDLPYLYRLYITSAVLRKPFFIYAASMGPFTNTVMNRLRRAVLSRASGIVVRDEVSASYLREQLGVASQVAADSALQDPVPTSASATTPGLDGLLERLTRHKYVGLVVSDLKWHPRHREDQATADRIIQAFRGLIRHLAQEGYRVLVVPQVFESWIDSGVPEALSAAAPEIVEVLADDLDSDDQQYIIGKLYCMISLRYHPVVFAAKASVPFVAVTYEHKSEDFIRRLGLSEYAIRAENVGEQQLIDRFRAVEEHHEELTRRIGRLVGDLVEESRVTTDRVAAASWCQASGSAH